MGTKIDESIQSGNLLNNELLHFGLRRVDLFDVVSFGRNKLSIVCTYEPF